MIGAAAGAGLWTWSQTGGVARPTTGPALRTAAVVQGPLIRTLRVGGTIQASDAASIRAPQLRGPGDTGSRQLTLTELAQPGTTVEAGAVMASFELRALADHIDDRQSALVQSEANVEKRLAEIMIERETDRQALDAAKAAYDKALLDLKTAEVRSEIESEILKNLAEQARVTWESLKREVELRETVHDADIKVLQTTVGEDRLHVERHLRDYDRMTLRTPLAGLVVMEPIYRGGGQFAQTEEGDQVYPGSVFMRVVSLSNMVLAASVNQADIQQVRMGQKAEVRLDAYPGLTIAGRVSGVGAIAESGGSGRFSRGGSGLYVKTVPVQITLDDSDERILPDLSGSADIVLAAPEEGLLAPREAVRASGDKTVVVVRSGQRFEEREVEVGPMNATHAVIAAGVEAGEELLLDELPKA